MHQFDADIQKQLAAEQENGDDDPAMLASPSADGAIDVLVPNFVLKNTSDA